MRHTLVGFIAAFLSIGAAHAAPPIELYGKDPEVSDVQISADGKKVAMSKAVNGHSGLFVFELATRKAAQYDLGNLKVRNIEWSSDNHVLIYASKTTNIMEYRSSLVEFCGAFSIDTRGKSSPKQLLGANGDLALQSSLCSIESRLWNDNGDVLMSARSFRGGNIQGEEAVFLVDGTTGRGKVVSRGTESTRYWVTSPKGYVVARIEHQQKTNRYRVAVPTNQERLGDYKVVFSEDTEIPKMSVYGANADETALIIGTSLKTDLYSLFEMSLTDGKIGTPLFEPNGVDIDGVITDPYTGTIVGAHYYRVRYEQIFFQNDLQAVLVGAQKALGDWETVQVVSWDRPRTKFVLYAQGSKSAGDYFILDRTQGKLEFLSGMRPDLNKADIAPVKPFVYKARDGLSLQGYLTLPAGAQSKNLPLVVLPHGGPAVRDIQRFDYWAQAMASRGYAVVQMNFRGSEGYGSRFQTAGEGEWGGKMQDDVTDGVKHLIDEGIADASKVCIVGGSYGGYAALAGAAFTPELYKCAVSVAGVSDLTRFLGWQRNRYGGDSSTYEYWLESIGNPAEDAAKIAERSPVNSAAKVTADVLLIHGKDDTVVAYEQSEFMRDALKAAGKPVQLIKLDGEDHWLSTEKTRTEMLKAIEGFLAKHLG